MRIRNGPARKFPGRQGPEMEMTLDREGGSQERLNQLRLS
jgi:hypothetical protein